MNQDEFEHLRETINNALDFAKRNSNTLNEDSAPLWNFAKTKSHATLDAIVINDIFNFLNVLGLSDDNISDEELDFINYILSSNYSKADFKNNLKKDTEYNSKDLPISFFLFYEFDRYVLIKGVISKEEIVEILFNIFKETGLALINLDDLSKIEKRAYDSYMNNLRKNLDDLKTSNYDLVVMALKTGLIENISDFNSFTLPSPDFSSAYDVEYSSIGKNPEIESKEGVDDQSADVSGEASDKTAEDLSEELEKIEEAEEEESLEDILAKLNKLVGLENVKKDVNSLINLIQIRKIREERGIKQPDMSLHLVFSGNPGTGKTTVARLLGAIYSKLGILSKGHLVETDRSGLVAGYVGQTAIKTQDKIKEAMGGILFIDEAYSLSASKGENDFGDEAIDTILKAMEDHRDDFIVIVAGYPKLMDEFLHSNPGLESRFNKYLYFDDYNPQELFDIFVSMESESSLKLDKKAEKFLKGHFEDVYNCRGDNFANGRYVRNIFEKALSNQANRLVNIEDISDDELNTLVIEDFDDCW